MSEKTRVLGVRLEAKLYDRLQSFEDSTHVEKVTLVRAAIIACLDYFEANGTFGFPLKLVPILAASDVAPRSRKGKN